jgi:hypothetical protein
VPIHSDLFHALAAARAEAGTSEHVLPGIAARYAKDRTSIEKPIAALFDDAGIKRVEDETPADRVRAPITAGFHSLRHSFVSICRQAGIPEAFVMSVVGHGSPAMTRHYTHIGEQAARAAIAALPAVTEDANADRREPLPEWAAELARKMTAQNWKKTRGELLKSASEQTAPLDAVLQITAASGTPDPSARREAGVRTGRAD